MDPVKSCQACGGEVRAGALFCARCGARVERGDASKRRLWALTAGGLGGVALVTAASAFFLLREDGGTADGAAAAAEVAANLTGQLGTEDAAVRATLRAIDRGYTFEQLAAAGDGGTLQPDGVALGSGGESVAPAAPPESRRYASANAGSRLMVRQGPPTSPVQPAAQEAGPLEADIAALNRMVTQFNAEPKSSLNRDLGALELLLSLARSGYNGAEIFGILASPTQRLVFHGGDFYMAGRVSSDGQLPTEHIECPSALTRSACERVLDGTRHVLDEDSVRHYFPGYSPAAGEPAEPDATVDPPSDTDDGSEQYAGMLDVALCGGGAAATVEDNIEVTVSGGAFELGLHWVCERQPWVTDHATGTHTCTYTLTIVGSATGTVDVAGKFEARGTNEQRTSNFEGPGCASQPYDGSNDSDGAFTAFGTVDADWITGFFHDDPPGDTPGVPFTLTRQ